MKKGSIKKLAILALVLLFTFGFIACAYEPNNNGGGQGSGQGQGDNNDNNDNDDYDNNNVPAAQSVTIIQGSEIDLTYPDNITLAASVVPAEANQGISWSIEGPDLDSELNSAGLFSPGGIEGTVTVRAAAASNSEVYSEININITVPEIIIDVTNVHIAQGATKSLGVRAQNPFSAAVYPANATAQNITWSIMRGRGLGSIDPNTGEFTAGVRTGAVIVRATAHNGVSAQTTVTITSAFNAFPTLQVDIRPNVNPNRDIPFTPNILHRDTWQDTLVSLSGTYSQFTFSNVPTRARGRGNSTWNFFGEKRPFRLRFGPSLPPEQLQTQVSPQWQAILSDYTARDWTFIANAIDYTHMRTYGAYFLGSMMDNLEYSPTHRFIHVYMGTATPGVHNYRGVYMLSDQLQVHERRVSIMQNRNLAPELNEYYFEFCHHPSNTDINFTTASGMPFDIASAAGDTDDIRFGTPAWPQHATWAERFIRSVDIAFNNRNYNTLSQLIDIPSFVDFYLVNEFFKNADAGFSSMYYTLRQTPDGPRLFGGPLWDFDQAAGSIRGGPNPSDWYHDYSPQGDWVAQENIWFRNMMQIPQIRSAVAARWREIRAAQVRDLLYHLGHVAATYRACFMRNAQRWPNIINWRIPPTVQNIGAASFDGQMSNLLNWFEARITWMDSFLS